MLFFQGLFKELKSSITFKVLKVVFSIYFVITLTVTAIHMYAEYKNEEKSVIYELELMEKTFNLPIAEALWNIDSDLVKTTVKGLLRNPVVIGVRVKPIGGKKSWGWEEGVLQESDGSVTYIGENQTENDKYMNSTLIVHKFDTFHKLHDDEEVHLGTTYIYSSKLIIYDGVKIGFMFIIINSIIKTVALILLFLWGGTKYLSRPLGTFADKVGAIKLDNLNEIHFVDNSDEKTELHLLQDAFNEMTINLKHSNMEQQKAKSALESSEKYLQEIFNSMPSMLLTIDVDDFVSDWNKAAYELTGTKREEAIGKKYSKVLTLFKEYLYLIKEAKKERKIRFVEKTQVKVNNENIFVQIVVYPLRLDNSLVVRIDNISSRVMMENIMVHTEKMTSLGTLAAGMAHEINNPLGGILQGIQNVKRRFDPNLQKNHEIADKYKIDLSSVQSYMEEREILSFLEGMRTLGERAAKIVKNVLRFSRRSDDYMSYSDINNIVQETIVIVSTDYSIKKETKFKEIQILTELNEDIPKVNCLSSEIEQVLVNLMKNAAHALADKESDEPGKIIIRTTKIKNGVRIEVEDNGTGVDDSIKEHLFEPFYTTKPVGVGTGLGLSISYYIIVDKHFGKLYVESEKGVGTKFIVELPVSNNLSSI